MRILISASSIDPAGSRIFEAAKRLVRTARIEHDVVCSLIDEPIIRSDPPEGFDLIIFCSKHAARSGNDAMCVHAIGNFGEASLGGRDGELVTTHPAMLSALYRALVARDPSTRTASYEVSLEAVHHGPYTSTPSIFYELGASDENWTDTDAARIMAEVLVETLGSHLEHRESFFGLGSNHYCAGFDRLLDRYDFAGSCAKHNLSDLTRVHLTWIAERYDHVVLDWNTLGKEKPRIIGLLDELGIRYERRKRM